MPVQKQDLHRALALLKDYHGQLIAAQDKPLQAAMDHVIFIFKGHLFQALIDVQEYYEMTLLNDIKSLQQETFDTVLKLETELPTDLHHLSALYHSNSMISEEPLPLPLSLSDAMYQNVHKIIEPKRVTPTPVTKKDESMDSWSYEEIFLERGAAGLGFSIAGGTDVPHIENDPGIYVTKVITGGAAFEDGRLRVNDIIVAVNGMSTVNITHAQSVEALKNAGRSVQLVVKRLNVPSKQTDIVKSSNAFTIPKIAGKHLISPGTENDNMQSGSKVSEKITRDLRKVVLRKGPIGFGFNIVGGDDGEGIFVSFIMSGGPADRCGQLHKGDQLISVNGIDIQEATHEQAAAALKGAGEVVEIALQYKPEEYRQFETKINDLREQMMIASTGSSVPMASIKQDFFVRALFDYNPLKDSEIPGRGLSFCFGDVLHVINNLDEEEWWQAQRVLPEEDIIGYIPSKRRVEMNARTYLRSSTDDKKKKKRSKKAAGHGEEVNEQLVSKDGTNQLIFSYQSVTKKEANYVRPLIVLGPLKDKIYDALISEFPDAFGSCIPHTTRAKKEHEVDGRDYHFVDSRDEMERDIENHLFVEAGQYSDNLYGTSIQSVKDVAENGKHCILDIGVSAILRLQSVGLYPITIFIKPKSVESLIQWGIAQEDAHEILKKTLHMEKEFGEHFTAVVSKENPDDIYMEVIRIIEQHSGPFVWISSDIVQC